MNSTTTNASPPAGPHVTPSVLLGIFLASVATLHLEILQTRIFSVLLWHHVTYLVVTFTLLGFAASGTFLTLFPQVLLGNPRRFLGLCSLLFAVTTFGAFQILGRSELDTLELLDDPTQYAIVFAYYLYLVVPYIFAGLVVVGTLRVAGAKTGLTYGVNLVGSALGCLLFALTLSRLGGESSVLLAVATAALAATAFAWNGPSRKTIGVGGLLVAAGSLGAMPSAEELLPFRAAKSKLMLYAMDQARERGDEPEIVARVWDPLCRIDVVDTHEAHKLMVYQDADAPTSIFGVDYPLEPLSIYALPYRLGTPEPEVLIIGVGGGQDLRHALFNGASKVTGVEINKSTAALLRGRFAEFSGHVYSAPGVTVHETEGRSFVRRTDERYDVIQMTGTDTYAALSSGSYVMSESYLYTVDAFEDYFDHLEDDGLLSVIRFRFFPPRESLRMMTIAVQALRNRGIEDPERHVIAVDRVNEVPVPGKPDRRAKIAYTTMLFKPTPFTDRQIDMAQRFVQLHPAGIYSLAYAPGVEVDTDFGAYLDAVAEDRDAQYMAEYRYQIDPVADDAPFFFNFHRWFEGEGKHEELEEDSEWTYFAAIGEDPVGLYLLVTAFIESLLLVALLVVLPLAAARRFPLPRTHRGSVLAYFLGIGIGFLFLEIAFMQRLVLYLGHPTRSITVVLFSFLLFSGIGSMVAGRMRPTRASRMALVALLALIAAYAVVLPTVVEHTLGWSTNARIAMTVAMLAVPAFFMGMPFPAALTRLVGPQAPFLPWAFAINGGASVLASVAAIFVAMAAGFTAVFWLALVCYAVALFADRGLPGEPAG